MKNSCINMIAELSDSFGPSGFEDEVIATAKKYTTFAETREDSMRNFYITPNSFTGVKPHVLLDAHSDEVGLMIHSIKPDGTLRFVSLGSVPPTCLESTAVTVRTASGHFISGVISGIPPHYAKQQKNFDPSMLAIDIGAANAEEAKQMDIAIGEPAAFSAVCEYSEESGVFLGKAFDCRVGCAALIETLRRLNDENLSVDVSGVLSSQEEVGERGAVVAANTVRPDIAICFEGCPADDTVVEPYAMQTKIKHGPMLRYVDVSMITNPRFQRFAFKIAEKYSIPIQGGVREGGGTNGAAYQRSGKGIPSIVIGVPVRYIHCPSCVTAYQDFEAAVELAVNIVKELNGEIIAGF